MKERIQKALANAGVASRRNVEQLVLEGRVTVNRRIVTELPVLIDPERATARVVLGALEAAPIVLGDASALFGGRVTGDFKQHFDARAADAVLIKAGVTNAVDRHIHVAVLSRAINEAAA